MCPLWPCWGRWMSVERIYPGRDSAGNLKNSTVRQHSWMVTHRKTVHRCMAGGSVSPDASLILCPFRQRGVHSVRVWHPHFQQAHHRTTTEWFLGSVDARLCSTSKQCHSGLRSASRSFEDPSWGGGIASARRTLVPPPESHTQASISDRRGKGAFFDNFYWKFFRLCWRKGKRLSILFPEGGGSVTRPDE